MIQSRRRSVVAFVALTALGAAAAVAVFSPSAVAADSKALDWKAAAAKIDALVAARFKSQPDLVVAPRSDDAEFLRRAALDITGVIPTEAEAVRFLQDASPDKRSALIDQLLASPRHAEHMATWYSNLLVGTAIRDRNMNRRTFNEWIRDQFSKNRPYDELVRDLITASGNSDENGAVGLVSSYDRSAADAAGKTSKLFLGVQIQCAQCHDHPYDKRIKKEDFGSYAAFFMTTTHRRNQVQGVPEISFDIMTYDKDEMSGGGRARGRTATPMARPGQPLVLNPDMRGAQAGIPDAKFLLGKTVKDVPGVNRRELLARWMTSKNNAWFADAFANRMWGYFLGHGIVHPVDDFNNVNKPTNPELLKFLSDELIRGGFDINHLIRTITNSEVYQRSSKNPRDMERPDASLFASGAIKPLTVEQSFDSFFRATGREQEMARGAASRGMGMGGMAAGARGQLVDPKMAIYQLFRRVFADDEAVEQEEFTGTIPRGLLMMNGAEINRMVSARPGSPLKTILDSERSDRERVRRVYLTALSREPSPGELSNALQHVHTSRTESDGYDDLLWALLNTTEFMSNH